MENDALGYGLQRCASRFGVPVFRIGLFVVDGCPHCFCELELANSIENAIAIAFLSTIAIAIDKAIFQLLLLLLLLIRASSNY